MICFAVRESSKSPWAVDEKPVKASISTTIVGTTNKL